MMVYLNEYIFPVNKILILISAQLDFIINHKQTQANRYIGIR